jgi:SnoaL-like domain
VAQEINEVVEAMNAHDLDEVVQLFHTDSHSEQPAHPAREFGTSAQVHANWYTMFKGIPDFHAELVSLG